MTTTRTLEGQVVWITGASSGIGEALSHEFAKRGASLVISARNQTELARVKNALIDAGASEAKILVIALDVTDHDSMAPARDTVVERFGRIDWLLNNAGISQRSFFVDTDLSVYKQMLDVNVLGQIALTQQVLPVMINQGAGHICVTASVAGKAGIPLRTGYCAAKHAVMGFFDALRTEVASQGIKVTTITPGYIRTNVSINALQGDGQPTGATDDNIAGGMDVNECAAEIMNGFDNGIEEIAVGKGDEMNLLALKQQNPTAAFRALEQLADQIRDPK